MSVEPLNPEPDRLEPHRAGPFTFADLDAAPDDGTRRELIDGVLLVTPAPALIHQRAALRIAAALDSVCPAEFEVVIAPYDYRPTAERSLQPDVLVLGSDETNPAHAEKPLLLAVEVLSPRTHLVARLKRSAYEQAGVHSYWIVEPDEETLTVLELVDGLYVERDVVVGEKVFEATLPFPVQIVPAELTRSRRT
ncbi:Uma2 family endonuclease [Kribbella antibiotica]|uniref:Uma2 family endonuclease n=1 Tax=Kribbella antibiotica TaxID=190195 RepID=UPI001EE0C321|nr:Uma2 family endonuclease [Kribbella antibiotica]